LSMIIVMPLFRGFPGRRPLGSDSSGGHIWYAVNSMVSLLVDCKVKYHQQYMRMPTRGFN